VARLLVQLKLRLLANALHSSTQAKVTFILSTIVAGLVAAGTFAGLAVLRGNSASVDLTTVVFTVFAFGWLILPLLVFGLDGTLDPATLAPFPLRIRPLAVGLLAASAAGAWPLANLIGLLGVTVGLARGGLGLLIALLAVLLEVLFCITLARFVTAAMAGLLRSRRGKDFAALLIIPIFALYEIFTQLVPKLTAEGKLTPASFAGVDVWMRWIPPGLAAHAIQDASTGHPGTALLRLALLAAVVVVLGGLWIRSLDHGLVTADASTQASAVRGTALPFGRFGLSGTVAARFWLYQRREPSSLIYWGITAVVMIAVSIRTITTSGYLGALLFSSVLGAALMGALHANAIGLSGPGFGLEAMGLAGRPALRSYFYGQDVAVAMIAVPLLTVISFGLAAVAGHPVDGFLGMAADLAGIGAGLALANVFTVTLPYPLEKRAGSPVPRPADGFTGDRLGGTFGALFGVAVAAIPVVLGVVFTRSDPAAVRMPVLVLCAAGYGLALAWIGGRLAAGAAESRLPELYQIAVRSKL
jgi:ABC-2 type transport system permease protein